MARRFGERIANDGYMVITGGGPGIMQAVNEGAGPDMSFGVNIKLPMEQKANPVIANNPRHIRYKYFFTRKVAFLKEAHAAVLFPGGYGTLDEAKETLTLIQNGKCDPMPIVLIDTPGGSYWKNWLNFMQSQVLEHGYINPADLSLFHLAFSVDEAVSHIKHFFLNYHSVRYVGNRLVIRLNHSLKDLCVKALREQYRDILNRPDGIKVSGPLPDEFDDPQIKHLPRVVVDFNRQDYGRLRSLIDSINNLSKMPEI
jgi:uncharacterized protein (TIGR00730 family)